MGIFFLEETRTHWKTNGAKYRAILEENCKNFYFGVDVNFQDGQ